MTRKERLTLRPEDVGQKKWFVSDGQAAPICLTQLTSNEQELLVSVRDSIEKRSFWIPNPNKINIDPIYYKLWTYCMITLHQNSLVSS